MRTKLTETTATLKEYYDNKQAYNELKKVCDAQNEYIKNRLLDNDETELTEDGYTAKVSTEVRESFDEDKLILALKSLSIPDVIKTREYVDMDALENYLYNNDISTETANSINACRESKIIHKLYIKKVKE